MKDLDMDQASPPETGLAEIRAAVAARLRHAMALDGAVRAMEGAATALRDMDLAPDLAMDSGWMVLKVELLPVPAPVARVSFAHRTKPDAEVGGGVQVTADWFAREARRAAAPAAKPDWYDWMVVPTAAPVVVPDAAPVIVLEAAPVVVPEAAPVVVPEAAPVVVPEAAVSDQVAPAAKAVRVPKPRTEPRVQMVRGVVHDVLPWTPAQEAQLLDLAAKGLSFSELGQKLGRSRQSVGAKLFKLRRAKAPLPKIAAKVPEQKSERAAPAPVTSIENAAAPSARATRVVVKPAPSARVVVAVEQKSEPRAAASDAAAWGIGPAIFAKSAKNPDPAAQSAGLVMAADPALPMLQRRMRDHLNALGNPPQFAPHVDLALVRDHLRGKALDAVAASIRVPLADALARWRAITAPFLTQPNPRRMAALPIEALSPLGAELAARAAAARTVADLAKAGAA